MAFWVKTFGDIIEAVREELGVQAGDSVALNKIRRLVNRTYINDVVAVEEWDWLRRSVDLTKRAKYTTGSASVTQSSRSVTLSSAPAFSLEGYWFKSKAYNERYRITGHDANSTTVTLDAPYTSATASDSGFVCWTDYVPLPIDAREPDRIVQDFRSEPLTGIGLNKFRRFESRGAASEGRPKYYTVGQLRDQSRYESITNFPASITRSSSKLLKTLEFASLVSEYLEVGDQIRISGASDDTYNGTAVVASISDTVITYVAKEQKTETTTTDTGISVALLDSTQTDEAYKELLVWPAVFEADITLHVDYIVDARPLDADTDEPVIPVEHRDILVTGALRRAWTTIGQDPAEAAANDALFQRKLSYMRGKLDSTTDHAVLRPSRDYLQGKRFQSRLRSRFDGDTFSSNPGGASSTSLRGTPDRAVQFNSEGNAEASPITTTELNYLDGTTSNIQSQLDSKLDSLTQSALTESTSSVLTITGGSDALFSATSIEVAQSSSDTDGYLSSTDWNTFNNKLATTDQGDFTESTSSVLTITGGSNATIGNVSIEVAQAASDTDGYLSSTDWNTFNNKINSSAQGDLTETTSNILTITGGSNATIGNVSIEVAQASSDTDGYLSSTDWNTFNNKVESASPTLTGTVTINAALTGTGVKDEDDMSSNASDAVATQQSIKAYVDRNTQVTTASSNTTITDSDNIRTLLVTTASDTITVTLPTAADNEDRILTIKKVDSGSGTVTVDGEGAETVDGFTTKDLNGQYDNLTIVSDGSNWQILGQPQSRYRIKSLSSDLDNTNNGDVSSMTFNNLEVGKTYRISVSMVANVVNGDSVLLYTYDGTSGGGTRINTLSGGMDGSSARNQGDGATFIHTMQNSTLTVEAVSIASGSTIRGDGTTNETYIMVEEVHNAEEYTGWD